jgi:hypothetical protein
MVILREILTDSRPAFEKAQIRLTAVTTERQ